LTDLWWLAFNAAPEHPQKAIYSIESPGEGATWINLAANEGIERFALVTLDHALPANIDAHLEQVGGAKMEITILQLVQVEDLLIYRLEMDFGEE
jgi:hypothetical protein